MEMMSGPSQKVLFFCPMKNTDLQLLGRLLPPSLTKSAGQNWDTVDHGLRSPDLDAKSDSKLSPKMKEMPNAPVWCFKNAHGASIFFSLQTMSRSWLLDDIGLVDGLRGTTTTVTSCGQMRKSHAAWNDPIGHILPVLSFIPCLFSAFFS